MLYSFLHTHTRTQVMDHEAVARKIQEGVREFTIPIRCSDPRLKEADVRIDADGGLQIHTGKYLSAKAHGLLGLMAREKLKTHDLVDVIRWLSTSVLLDEIVQEHYKGGTGPCDTYRCWIYFHHLCSPAKVTQAVSWAHDLSLDGLVIPGQPGCCVVEGALHNIASFAERLRLFSWRDMKILITTQVKRPVSWKGLRHICDAYPSCVQHGKGPNGRDTTDYGSLADSISDALAGDLLSLLPCFAGGKVPEHDAPFPVPAPSTTSGKKKKNRLQ